MANEISQLSDREREILKLAATGLSNQQIASQLSISPNTVKVHLRNIFGKIGVASRTEASLFAVRNGLVEINRVPVSAPETIAESPPIDSAPLPDQPLPDPPSTAEAEIVPAYEPTPTPVVEVVAPSLAVAPRRGLRWGRVALVIIGVVLLSFALVAGARSLGLLNNRAELPIVGGVSAGAMPSTAAESRWKTLPTLRTPRAAFAVAVVGDQVFLIGGQNQNGVLGSVERYDLRFESWTNLSDKPTPVTDVHAAVLGEKIYVPGGRRSDDVSDITAAFERYDPRTETWEKLPDLPEPRSGYALAQIEGNLYLFGGWDGQSYRNSVFEYDPDAQRWSERTPMPTARAYGDAVVIGSAVHVIGGEDQSGALDRHEVYTPAREGEQAWSRRPPLPDRRSHFGAAVEPAFGTIFIFGGLGNAAPLQYRSDRDAWEQMQAPPAPIGSQPGVVQQSGAIVVLGGSSGDQYATEMQSYQATFTLPFPAP